MTQPLPASFRDRSGYVFRDRGVVCRAVSVSYQADYDQLVASGLLALLQDRGWLVKHAEVTKPVVKDAYKVLKPEQLDFISYPYEWSFSQLKAAALLTLEIQATALEHGMILKDASVYNVQFRGTVPVFIDTLSFERYTAGSPWVAYRQFCQHFLAPLALMAKVDVRLQQLLRTYLDGIPLDLAVGLLPAAAKARPGIALHLALHAKAQSKYEYSERAVKTRSTNAKALVSSLRATIAKLEWKPPKTEWGNYYDATNYSDAGFARKRYLVEQFLADAKPQTVWDLGGNTGEFSEAGVAVGAKVLCFDIDPVAVEHCTRNRPDQTDITPLLLDLTNPSPSQGWAHAERDSLIARGPADAVLALALVHHLAIGNNVPLVDVAKFLSTCAKHVVIEWVPKNDSQVLRLLATRQDQYDEYTKEGFEDAMQTAFMIVRNEAIAGTERHLYLLCRT